MHKCILHTYTYTAAIAMAAVLFFNISICFSYEIRNLIEQSTFLLEQSHEFKFWGHLMGQILK